MVRKTFVNCAPTKEATGKVKKKRIKRDKKDAEDRAQLIEVGCFILLGVVLYRYWVIVALVVWLYYRGVKLVKKNAKRKWQHIQSGKSKKNKTKKVKKQEKE